MEPFAEGFGRLTRPLPEPHLLVSASGEIVAANPAAAWRLGLSLSREPGASLLALTAEPPEQLLTYLRACAGSGTLLPGRLSLRTAAGEPPHYRCEGAAVRPHSAEHEALILLRLRPHEQASRRFLLLNQKIAELGKEIHERRRVENALQVQALQLEDNAAELELMIEQLELQKHEAEEANRSKSEFLAVMSHELRTPLNAVVGYAGLLETEINGTLTAGQRRQVERIKRSAFHLTDIINEILDFARLEAGRERVELEEVELGAIAREAAELVELAASERGIAVAVDVPPDPVRLTTDAAKVRQILLNLLSNAVKFTDGGDVRMTVRRDADFARVAIADTGIGITPEDLAHIFEPYWQVERGTTRRAGGTGLGLTVTRRFALLLGGDVTATSTPGIGSVFTLILPTTPPGQPT